LEKIESVDMMRILENGMKVRMVLSPSETKSVDTETDLAAAQKLMESDPLLVFNCINYRYLIVCGQGGKNYGQKTTCSRMFGKRQKDVGIVGA
jgi:hypothetical protein